ncbi:MAG: radical SAM protein [Deltaproteobacteria bacterium]|nr:radical SAM protein [Deltaproteobacteria bacterium]
MADDLFTANKRHCLGVCNEIIERGLKIEWTSFGRVDTVSREVLAKMEEAGCHAISFGVESANAEILKTIRKGITIEQVISAVKMCKDAGIMAHISFILGLPGETPETLKETVEFGERLKELGAYHGFHLLAPFPGTEVRQESDKYGIKILTNDWTQYHANRAIVETSSVSQDMLNETVMEWEKEFDERLGKIKGLMERGEATKEEAWQLQKLEHTVLIYDLMMGMVLEEKGFWNHKDETNSGDALKKLINNIEGSIDYSRKQISETLKFSVEQGYLRYTEEKGQIRWEWVDSL